MPPPPLVSLCIPTWNGARWVREALDSALGQNYGRLEILVVDDGSTDDTLSIVHHCSDPRLRVETNAVNLGAVGNWNRCLALARGELVKFLFQDDRLHPDCVERMAAAAEDPAVGLVFCRREIVLEDPSDPAGQAWKRDYGILDTRFERLGPRNHGRDLFDQWARSGFRMNWIGEPTCVLLRREAVRRVGGFHTRMFQGPDFELWIRLLFFFDAAFIAEPLCDFRVHPASASRANDRENRPWLDMPWLLEGLLEHPEIAAACPQVRRMRFKEWLRMLRMQARRVRAGRPMPPGFLVRSLGEYMAYRARRWSGRAPRLHPEIPANNLSSN